MKTKIIVTCLLATGLSITSFAQNDWKSEISNSYLAAEAPPKVLSRSQTFFGADMEYSTEGAKIINVIPNTPAETYSFKKGDVLTAIGNIAINSEDSYKQAMEMNKPDDLVAVSFIRKGVQKERKVKLDKITVYKNAGTR